MDVQKILWPTDLSGSAKQALSYVQSVTEKYQAEIHVIYVIEDIAHHRGLYGNSTQNHIDKIIAWENKRAKEYKNHIGSLTA